MSIERIELNGDVMIGRYPSQHGTAAKPREYNNKSLLTHLARVEYRTAVTRQEALAKNLQLVAIAGKYADITKINNQGLYDPMPNVNYIKGRVDNNFFYYKGSVGKIIDKMA